MAPHISAIIVTLRNDNPSQLPLACNVSLGAFSLRLQRIELLVQAFFGGFPGVDRATQWGGSRPFFVTPRRHFIRNHGVAPRCLRDGKRETQSTAGRSHAGPPPSSSSRPA